MKVEQLLLELFVSTIMTPWLSFNLNWRFLLWNWHFGGQKFLGNHPVRLCRGGPPFGGKNCFLNTFTKTFLTKNKQLFSWTFPTWLVAVMCVDREARAWFGELSWHLKVPSNLISAKRFPIHTLRVEQLRLEVFCFEDNGAMTQFQFELKFPTAELTFQWPEISWKPSSLAVTWGPPLWNRKNWFLNTLTRNFQVFLWTFPMWLVAVMCVDREARAWFGELSWHLKVPWNLINAK